jgi:signal transduction histidine kinase
MDKIREGDLDCKCQIDTENSLFAQVADGINHLGDGLKAAVELSLKDERMKTELITNVSHDLKTPLTSIINYVDLLKKEDIPGEDAKHYLEVLDAKSQRLKQLTEDLVEAAKANSGNIELECMPLAFDELMRQAIGEFEDKFATRNLTVVASYPEAPAVIMGDGRRIYRIIENLLQNAYKYALEGTRIYADLSNHGGEVAFTLKNVSSAQLNISPEELMERFTRGDESRTTEGSGLGLSIAKDLTKLMEGSFEILLDGDLFKVIVTFPEYVKEGDGEN